PETFRKGPARAGAVAAKGTPDFRVRRIVRPAALTGGRAGANGETSQGPDQEGGTASRGRAMSPYLAHLARRVSDAPDFLACALAEYARSERLEDAGLAARLGCPVEILTHLRLCRMPRTEPPHFWQDVEQIAKRFSVNTEALADVARRGQSLFHLRK